MRYSSVDNAKSSVAQESSSYHSKNALSEGSPLLPVDNSTPELDSSGEFWTHPCLLSAAVTLGVLLPTLLSASLLLFQIVEHAWVDALPAIHLVTSLVSAYWQLSMTSPAPQLFSSVTSLLDILACGTIYPTIGNTLHRGFVDIDDRVIPDWRHFHRLALCLRLGCLLVTVLRLCVGTACWLCIAYKSTLWTRLEQRLPNFALSLIRRLLKFLVDIHMGIQLRVLSKCLDPKKTLRKISLLFLMMSLVWLLYCFGSCVLAFTTWRWWWKGTHLPLDACCDDLDRTECYLPFPSFHHMVPDESSKTGWRVNLQGRSLPITRTGWLVDMHFLNELDGFSTMAPILFYLDGLQESHLAEVHGLKERAFPRLVQDSLQDSTTSRSITYLWNVETATLVPHTANIDAVDSAGPLVMVVPSQPLRHSSHYAVAVLGATDVNGKLLRPSTGLTELWQQNTSTSCNWDINRRQRYEKVLLPSLKQAAPWITLDHSRSSLQLLFDFATMSEDSLRPIRRVRDATLEEVSSWDHHQVNTTKIVNRNCKRKGNLIARSVHGSIQVPWFLEADSRTATLSPIHLQNGKTPPMGTAKFVVHIPCSLRAAALDLPKQLKKPLRAIVDYGHGVMYNRAESGEYSLTRVAHDHGYLIVAVDWRGSCSFDIPIVLRTLLSEPQTIEVIRDNLIQGYANRMVMEHFAKDGLLQRDWLAFGGGKRQGDLCRIPLHKATTGNSTKQLPLVFYGNSQGGILGAGYTALTSSAGWIDRAILGEAGTSLAVVLTHSKEFDMYGSMLHRNFYTSRDVRLMLSIFQMAYDPVEASGLLATGMDPNFPRILLQSGLGDATVPTQATEILARAYNASILPHNPRQEIFGITSNITRDGPTVAWTEILFEKEYQNLPTMQYNVFGPTANTVHMCLRQDCGALAQMAEFVNSGRVVDPCREDGCRRTEMSCFYYWKHWNNRPRYWTCPYYNQSNTDE